MWCDDLPSTASRFPLSTVVHMTAHFTFGVCISCGVQSQPILMLDGEPLEVDIALRKMGWKFDRLRFNIAATCPGCLKDQNAKAKEAQGARMDGLLSGVSGRDDDLVEGT